MADYKTIALTGHRPNKLWGYDLSRPEYQKVKDALLDAVQRSGADTIISGMALGFDQIGAVFAKENGLKLIAAVPFKGQEKAWPAPSQRTYNDILQSADETHIVSEGGYEGWKMTKRDQWMVDHADLVVALWDGSNSGTGHTVAYAQSKRKPLWILNPAAVTLDGTARFLPTA